MDRSFAARGVSIHKMILNFAELQVIQHLVVTKGKIVLLVKSAQMDNVPLHVWMDKSIAAKNASIQKQMSLSAARLEPPQLAKTPASHVLQDKNVRTDHAPRRVWMGRSIAVVNASIQIQTLLSAGLREPPRLAKTPG